MSKMTMLLNCIRLNRYSCSKPTCPYVQKTMMALVIKGKSLHRVSLSLPLDESFGPHLCLLRVEVNIEHCQSDENVLLCSTDTRHNNASGVRISATEVNVVISLSSFI